METTDSRSTVTLSMERRTVPVAVELRGTTITESPTGRQVFGHAAIFNSESRLIPRMTGGSFVEQVAVGFFDNARNAGWPGNQGAGVQCRYNHSDNHLLGSTRATPPTLTLAVDHRGLEYVADVPICRSDVVELIGRGEITNSSFTFSSALDSWLFRNGVAHRTLISGELWDVAPVSAVAGYTDTSCALRSLAASKDIPAEDVFALAEQDELRKLFKRTDIDGGAPAKTLSGMEAYVKMQGRRWPQPRRSKAATTTGTWSYVDEYRAGQRLIRLQAKRIGW